jgi:glycerophosphoryl diester phosphodiesterase
MVGWLKIILLWLIIIVIGYYAGYFIANLQFQADRAADPQVIAHRGDRAHAPEDTLAAFRKAVLAGANWIELDVQRTKDGQLVVIHDETVDRTTDGSGRVGDLTLEQVQALDAGDGEPVPTFQEAIRFAQEAGVGFFPEAKSAPLYPGIEGEMVAVLRQEGYLERTILQSFAYDGLAQVAADNPDLQICPLFGLWQFNLRSPGLESAKQVCPMGEMVLLYPWMIRQAHQDGRQVYVWFGAIEHPLVMRLMLALGADGLIVDDPGRLARMLGR